MFEMLLGSISLIGADTRRHSYAIYRGSRLNEKLTRNNFTSMSFWMGAVELDSKFVAILPLVFSRKNPRGVAVVCGVTLSCLTGSKSSATGMPSTCTGSQGCSGLSEFGSVAFAASGCS